MGRKKLERFADNAASHNVIQQGKSIYDEIRSLWHAKYFKNDHDIVLELACGRGEYTVGLAQLFPERNYIGVDIKGARIWKGSQAAMEKKLSNVAFLRTQIQQIDRFFGEAEVNDIWIVFPDPQPGSERKRLTHPNFLEKYKQILKPGGVVRLKTDSDLLFQYTLDALQLRPDIRNLVYTEDLYNSKMLEEHYGITTRYENQFTGEGKKIKYLRFSF